MFNQQLYEREINIFNNDINTLISQVKSYFNGMKAENNQLKNVPQNILDKVTSKTTKQITSTVTQYDEFKELFRDLNEEWKSLEYESCFLQDPEKLFNIDAMGGLIDPSIF